MKNWSFVEGGCDKVGLGSGYPSGTITADMFQEEGVGEEHAQSLLQLYFTTQPHCTPITLDEGVHYTCFHAI